MRVSHRSLDRAAWTRFANDRRATCTELRILKSCAALTATFHGMITVINYVLSDVQVTSVRLN